MNSRGFVFLNDVRSNLVWPISAFHAVWINWFITNHNSPFSELIKSVGKKSYTFVVGKINVPKLANFQEIEAFVLVACPENR